MNPDNSEFQEKSINEIQNDYFINYLNYDGWYKYEKNGLNAEVGDLLLFQMNNSIIASAIYSMPMAKSNHFVVQKGTVKVFKPIDKDEFMGMFNGFKRFSNAKFSIDPTKEQMDLLIKRMDIIE